MTSPYLKELFEIALYIADFSTPHIMAVPFLKRHEEHALQLISCGAFSETDCLKSVLKRYNQDLVFRKVKCDNAGLYYSAPGVKRAPIDKIEITVYALSFNWMLKGILFGLGISTKHKCIPILDQFIWNLGNIKVKHLSIPIIVVRRLRIGEVYESLTKYLESKHEIIPALVIVLDSELPVHLKLSSPNILMTRQDILLHDESEVLSFDIPLILAKMDKTVRKEGFSDGYRSAYFNGVTYTFSKKQAEVIELLDKEGKPMHQDEIMSLISTNSNNSRLASIFQSKGEMHPAWGIIIKHDSRGNYWLEY